MLWNSIDQLPQCFTVSITDLHRPIQMKLDASPYTVVPLLRDHPVVHTDVVFEEGWSFIRGRKLCKPKHVSSGIVVLNVRWFFIRVVSQEGDYCTSIKNYFFYKPNVKKNCQDSKTLYSSHNLILTLPQNV